MGKKSKEFRTPHQKMIQGYQPARLVEYGDELKARIVEEEAKDALACNWLLIGNLKARLRDVAERVQELNNA